MSFNRKKLRLSNYDYSSCGAYFITICTQNKEKILSEIRRGDPRGLPKLKLTDLGKIAQATIADIEIPGQVKVDKYVIMPNHIHFIIRLCCHYKVSRLVGKYKSLCANRWLSFCKSNHLEYSQIGQRSFYDHVIRSEQDFLDIAKYIEENPIKWTLDKYYL